VLVKRRKTPYKAVPPHILRAFGFKRMRYAHGGYPKGAWCNSAFDLVGGLYYDPYAHSTQAFVRNLMTQTAALMRCRQARSNNDTVELIQQGFIP
jgi:hypothetical protein